MNVASLLRSGADLLKGVSLTSFLDASILLRHVSGWNETQLVTRGEDDATAFEAPFMELITRRREGEPVAYLVGNKEFWGRAFHVSPSVLVPRPESELLIERGLAFLERRTEATRILDIGTGSGCLIVTLCAEAMSRKFEVECVATDVSPNALGVAIENARCLGVADQILFVEADMLPPTERFDLVVSNPPYIADTDTDVSRETAREPRIALYAGPTGLEFYERLIPRLQDVMNPGGQVLLECGMGQASIIAERCRALLSNVSDIQLFKDLQGIDRVVSVSYTRRA